MAIAVGQQAPGFTLYDTQKSKVTLQDFRGKNVVLLFFPLAFTSVCTKELCEIRDSYSFYENMNAEVFGISVDSLFTNAKFKEANQINFRLLSDFNKEVSTAYDSIFENFSYEYQGVSKRATFVIDKNGTIVYIEILEVAHDYPNMAKLKEAVSSLS